MNQDDEAVTVVVFDPSCCLIAENLDTDTVTTLIALVSDDPASWDEAMSVWRRYRTPAVCEFISSVPLEPTDRDEMNRALLSADAWVVIDFQSKRVCTGGQFIPIGRDSVFAMVEDELGKQHCPLSVHLPPWWELHEAVTPDVVSEPRQSPMNRPHVDRDVLYGNAFLTEIATRVLDVAGSDAWRDSEARDDEQVRYPFTIAIHRDWLMTPREDLHGRIPRELLHGAIEWIDKVTGGQRRRFEDGGPMVAAPNDWVGFSTAPMGSQELCLYFDLCRELISAGWFWCESEEAKLARQSNELALNQLIQFLGGAKDEWLSSSFEGGSPPSFIIECDRRRVPRGAGVEIDGLDEVQSEQHIADCDCPICEMMDDGIFGVGFTSIDGHHLELDDEFAFSMLETREALEAQQLEYAEFSAKMARERAERDAAGETDDPFESAWSGINSNESMLGDSPFSGKQGGHLKMAFMVAEIVSELENCSESGDEIKGLNESFANYRRCDDDERPQRATELKANLQLLADRFPYLISKSADLQSQLDEAERASAVNNSELDFPF